MFTEVEQDLDYLPYELVQDLHGRPLIKLGWRGVERSFKPEEISAMILNQMKETAEQYLGQQVKKAVITVPAYFNDAQRQATKDAAVISGLDCIRIINEPTAACLCYGLDKKSDDIHVLVFDLGGGTFDVSVLCLDGGVFQVLATNGNTHLGGEDIDRILVDFMVEQFEQQTGLELDLTSHPRALKKLQFACEQAKRHLSSTASALLSIDSLYKDQDFNYTLSRSAFEQLAEPVLQQCMKPVRRVLRDSELEPEQIDEIVLVGGSTRIPKLQEMLSKFFNHKKLNKSVNPDEAVAYGATVQGAILTDQSTVKDLILLDVTPLSMGIETSGGIMARIIERNSNIPCHPSKMFTTIEDNQNSVLIQVFEGERKFTKDNHALGTFELGPIPEAPRGVPKIKVTFKLDSNGILQVTALDKNTGLSTEAKLTRESGRLSQDDINTMVEDAENYKLEDELRHASLQEMNQFERYLYSVQNSINDPQINANLTEEQISFVNQYVINTFQWMNESRDNREVSKEVIQQARSQVEYNLRPFMYQIYSRTQEVAKTPGAPQQLGREEIYQTQKQVDQYIDQVTAMLPPDQSQMSAQSQPQTLDGSTAQTQTNAAPLG